MNRMHLFVAPEDYPQVRALGACWDQQAKCWYIDAAMSRERFGAWLPDAEAQGGPGTDFFIESPEAYIARAATACRRCRRSIEVVCLYCRRGTVGAQPLEAFRVQYIWAVDADLRRQLRRWPGYRMDASAGVYLNHCPHCGARQDEADLHEEPGQAFHDLGREVPDGVRLEALEGRVRLSGDDCVEV